MGYYVGSVRQSYLREVFPSVVVDVAPQKERFGELDEVVVQRARVFNKAHELVEIHRAGIVVLNACQVEDWG